MCRAWQLLSHDESCSFTPTLVLQTLHQSTIMTAKQDVENRQISSNPYVNGHRAFQFLHTDQPQPGSRIAEPRNRVRQSFLFYDAHPRITLDQYSNHPIAGKPIRATCRGDRYVLKY